MAYVHNNNQWSQAAYLPVSYHHSPDDSEMGGGGSGYGNNTGHTLSGLPHNSSGLFGISDAPYVPPNTHMQTPIDHDLILPNETYSSNFSGSAENLHQQPQYYNYQQPANYNINPTQSQHQWGMDQQMHGYQQYPQPNQQRYQMPYGATQSGHQNIAPLPLSQQQASPYTTASPASSQSSGYDSPRHSPGLHQHAMAQSYPYPPHRQSSHPAMLPPSSRASPSDSDNLELPDHNSNDAAVEEWLRREANIPRGNPVGLNGIPGNYDNPAEKPPLAHRVLMGLAIHESPERQLTLSQIYDAIERRFAYYADPKNGKKWQRSMRHSLSLYMMFKNKQRPLHGTGKGGYWTVRIPDPSKPYKRERKRRATGTAYADDDDTSEEYDESDDAASVQSDSVGVHPNTRAGYSSRAVAFGQSSMPGSSGHSTRPSRSGSAPSSLNYGSGAYTGPPHHGHRQHHQVDAPERRLTRRG